MDHDGCEVLDETADQLWRKVIDGGYWEESMMVQGSTVRVWMLQGLEMEYH